MSADKAFADHFSVSAAQYSQFRPGYPPELFSYLAEVSPCRDCIWDCASGSGQAAIEASQYFRCVIATDASYQQLRNAQTADNIFYATCLAEQTPFIDRAFDLIMVAQALHWFKLERFYAEVRRLLKPSGLLAVWTYNLLQINPRVDELIRHLYSDILGDYWAFERKLVENGYRDLDFPFACRPTPEFAMQSHWTLQQLLGYLSTWSAVKSYREKNDLDPLSLVQEELARAWGDTEEQLVRWPLALKLGVV